MITIVQLINSGSPIPIASKKLIPEPEPDPEDDDGGGPKPPGGLKLDRSKSGIEVSFKDAKLELAVDKVELAADKVELTVVFKLFSYEFIVFKLAFKFASNPLRT